MPAPPPQLNWGNAKRLIGALSALVGALALAGWAMNIPALKSVNSAWVAMKANTAICFILLGLAMMSGPSASSFRSRASRLCALAIAILGALTLGEYITGTSLGIDQLLFLEPRGAAGTVDLGRMAPDTAACFVLLGAALSLPDGLQNIRGGSLPVVFGFLAAAIGLVSLTAYAILPPFAGFGWWGKTAMAVQTAALFAAAGAAVAADAIKEEAGAWEIGRRVTAAFMAGTILAVCIGYYSHRSVVQLISADQEIAANEEILRSAADVLSAVSQAEAVARDHILKGDKKYLPEFSARQTSALDKIDAFLGAVSLDPSRDLDDGRFARKATDVIGWQSQVLSAYGAGRRISLPHALSRGEALRDEMTLAFKQLERTSLKKALGKRRLSSELASFTNRIIFLGLLLELSILLAALLGINHSQVQRRLANEVLRVSEDRYRGIIETTMECFCEIDAAGIIVATNLRMNQMFGYVPGEMIGLVIIEDLYFPEDRIQLLKRLERRAKGVSETFEQRFKTKTGEPLWMIVSATPIMSADGVYRGSFAMMSDITSRKLSEAELRQLQTAVEQTGESLFITDGTGTIQYVNPAFEASTGYSRREILGKNPRILKSGKQDEAFYRQLWETISSGRVWKGRLINKRKDGSFLTEDATISPVRDAEGQIVNYVAVKRDVTEHVQLENELRQSQKMESVGRLAGGVAHDFNNILTAINGYTGFALAGLPEGDPRREDLKEVLIASGRATRLTRQLLAFSRKQILDPKTMDINASINETVSMLKRVIGEDVSLKTKLAASPCLAKVDAGQIEQVFLNLAVNARDAMPKGGTLLFETEVVPVTKTFLSRHPETPPKSLVCLSAHDTGCGMTEEVKAHIFEPFFTTKEKGKGTGLGLSTVYGIVKQSGGDIEVESAPGRGTTFRIYFPQINPQIQTQKKDKDKSAGAVPGGNETVLLVEDEGILRRLGARALIAGGYTVLLAANGQEALRALSEHGQAVDLLITDVVMPSMNGRELALSIASTKMARRTLFISGFTDDAIVKHGVLEPGLAFLYKPFTPEELLRKMREVLDGPADKARA